MFQMSVLKKTTNYISNRLNKHIIYTSKNFYVIEYDILSSIVLNWSLYMFGKDTWVKSNSIFFYG